VYENTVIIYTTDHGEHLFEHGLRGKHCMYEDAVNIPFIISYPKLFQSNTTNNSLASLIDIFPTFCEMAGIAVPEEVQGRSLVEALKNGTEVEGRKFVFSEFRGADYKLIPGVKNVPSRMIRFDDYKFVYTHGIIHQLYDLKNDPDELDNLIFDEKYQSLAEELYFLTMAEWRFQEYEPLKASVKQGMLKWQDFEQVQDYTLFYAKEDDPTQAKAMAHGLTSNSYELSEEGYYWVLAHPKLTKTSPRFGELPVALAEYSYQLPISDPVKF
jgi:arylsulfatase A-like enzyme